VKWNDGLLADSMEASKKTGGFCNKALVVEPYSKEDSAAPPLKSSADTTSNEKKVVSNGKKGFLRKGFLNRRPSVLAPSTNSSLPICSFISLKSEDMDLLITKESTKLFLQ
jgi:hypothetical protein